MTTSKSTKKTGSSAMKQSTLGFAPQKSSAFSKTKDKRTASRTSSVASVSVSEAASVDGGDDADVPKTPAVEERREPAVVEELKPNDKRWTKPMQWARGKNNHLKPIHGEGQDKLDYILRVFDNSHEYGPCVGMPRLQRWERAHAMGLNPPPEIRDILLTRQGQEESRLSQSCFHGEV